MAREFAKGLYKSQAWRDCRMAFMSSRDWICERCGQAANTAHHKTYVTPRNINDPMITMNPANLEALCETCHQHEHNKTQEVIARGLMFDAAGNVIAKPPLSKR